MIHYVNAGAPAGSDGSKAYPFQTISAAAQIARPGDEVLVAPGIYREEVSPRFAGTEEARITYRSEVKGAAVITGAEPVKCWERYQGDTWVCRLPSGLFAGCNPYTTLVSGDWFIASYIAHTGEVYLNNKSLYEVNSLEAVLNPQFYEASWDRDFTTWTWYTEQDNGETVIYANFHGLDPNAENVEINVRPHCFYPAEEGIGYITLSGFTVCKAAVQWAPPTAYQEGMVGPHWSRGWIIEDCEISHAKCSGISLGKYLQPENNNKWLYRKFKDGTQTERDAICQAQREGWTKERIGHHIIRRCNIHDCGQTGIVGHLGGVFSLIEGNHIHHINNKQNLAGAEIGGIKMHAAIDVIIRGNHIHHCTRGLWLDWQAQGTRVTQNLFHHNSLHPQTESTRLIGAPGEDIFIEVSHGPTLIDNNFLLSERSLKLATQGVAVVHNLLGGALTCVGRGTDNGARSKSSPRYTPYHVQHRTEIAGFMTILHGDIRFYNNLFVQGSLTPAMLGMKEACRENEWEDGNFECGTFPYEDYPTEEAWLREFEGYVGMGSSPSNRYYMRLPVWAAGNSFYGGAKPLSREKDADVHAEDVTLAIEEREDGWYLVTSLYSTPPAAGRATVSTETLGMAFEPEQRFENPDGTPIVFNRDFFGNGRPVRVTAGPLEGGSAEIRLWSAEQP